MVEVIIVALCCAFGLWWVALFRDALDLVAVRFRDRRVTKQLKALKRRL